MLFSLFVYLCLSNLSVYLFVCLSICLTDLLSICLIHVYVEEGAREEEETEGNGD